MRHVMVVVPADSDINETQNVTEKDRQNRSQRLHGVAMRYFQLKHHDRDDDRDHSVAECFQSPFGHVVSLIAGRLLVTCRSIAAGSRASNGISNSKMQACLAIDVFGLGRNGRQGPIKGAARA
jgi:hypothetical protein